MLVVEQKRKKDPVKETLEMISYSCNTFSSYAESNSHHKPLAEMDTISYPHSTNTIANHFVYTIIRNFYSGAGKSEFFFVLMFYLPVIPNGDFLLEEQKTM
jgi:hypothetical protein